MLCSHKPDIFRHRMIYVGLFRFQDAMNNTPRSHSTIRVTRIFQVLPAVALTMGCLSMQAEPADSLSGVSHAALSCDSMPAKYAAATDEPQSFPEIPMPDSDLWWSNFNDSSLTSLIQSAVANNYNLKGAIKRIEASRQILRSTYSGYYPTIGLTAGYDVSKESGRIEKPYGSVPSTSSFSLGATMSWEIDVFGRVAEKAKGSKASLSASRVEYEGMMLTIASEVATTYGNLRMYEQQLQVARSHIDSQQEMLRIVESRYASGLVSKLDVAQARNTLNSTLLLVPQLESEVRDSKYALATLCGLDIAAIDDIIAEATHPEIPAQFEVGIPADLIRRRPDIVEAEQQIAVLASQLGVARKDWLPTLTLNASVATSSHDVDGLFGKHSLQYSVTPQLSWTLFDGFARDAGIAEAKAEMEAEIDTYNMDLLTAIQEVNTAISDYEAAQSELKLYADVLKDSQELLSLAIERYDLGLTDFSDVTSAQISVLSQQTSYEAASASCFTKAIAIYKALGGGWNYAAPDK